MRDELSRVVDALPGIVWTALPDGRLDFLNQRWREYTGLSVDVARGSGWQAAIHTSDLPKLLELLVSNLRSGESGEIEARLRRFDGTYRWFLFRLCPLADPSGQVAKWCGIASDIDERKRVLQADFDERKRAEAELRRGEARKTAILNSALDCIVTIDHEGCFTEFNPAAERTFGYRRDQVIGRHIADIIIPPSLREQHRRGFARYLATGEARVLGKRVEMTAVRADGSEFPVELAITRIQSDGPPAFTGYLRDITERKQAEGELQRSEAFLAEGQRLSRTGSFSWRLDTGEIRWSEQVYRIFELDSDLPVTLELIDSRVHPEDLPLMRDMVERAQAGKDFEYKHRLQLPDNRIKYLHLMAHGTRTSDGQLEYIGAVQDVTDRQLSDEALGKLRSELAHMAEPRAWER